MTVAYRLSEDPEGKTLNRRASLEYENQKLKYAL